MKKFLIAVLLMAPVTMFAQKFAHFSTTDIIPNMKEYTTAQSEIESLAKQYDDDMKRMQDEFQKKSDDYQKESAKLLDNVKQRREAELQELYQRIQQSYQDNQQALQKAQTEKLAAIQQLVVAAIKKVGEAGGYIYIVDTSTGAIPFVSTTQSVDVTADIKKALGITGSAAAAPAATAATKK